MKAILENEEYLIRMRRHFHVNAEPSDREDETVKTICEELSGMGIAHVDVPKGGVLGFIDSGKPGKTVVLRADIDALPMDEEPNNLAGPKVCVSAKPGAAHTCGHDGHTAMLLTAAKVLHENKALLNGKVVLMFERGEEGTGNFVYLYKYIRDNNIHIDSLFGTHLYALLETGKVSIRDGDVMSGAVGMNFKITGRGGHGSRPDQSVNPLDCFVAIYNGYSSLRMRCLSPFNTFTSVIPMVHAGTMGNIIPDSIEFCGGARVFEVEDAHIFKEEMTNLVENTCKAYHCTAEVLDLRGPMFAVKNDPTCAQMAREVIGGAIGEEHLEEVEPWMASDCVSSHMAMWPGVFALVGIQNEEKGVGAPHHNGFFDLDEDALKYGASAFVSYAIGFLNSDIDTAKSPYKFHGSYYELLAASTASARRRQMLDILAE